jgi:DNA polymerase-3 subunit delta
VTAAKVQALDGFLRKPDPAIAAILIHGDDLGEVHDHAAAIVRKIAGSIDDPFNVMTLDEAALAGDGGRIVDEVQAQSLLGGRRAVWVRGAGASFLKAMAPVLAGEISGNLVVAESTALARTSPLRSRFEESPHALAVALYEASPEDAQARVVTLLRREGFAITEEATLKLVELAGTSAPLLEREVEKLASYARGRSEVSLADVEILCGAAAETTADDLVDAALGGDVVLADRQFALIVQAGGDPGAVLSALLQHLQRLADLKIVIERGMKAEQALRSARPPVFFKRHGAMLGQLRTWTLADLLGASATVAAAIPEARLTSTLAQSLASRAVLAVARNGRALQSRSMR